MEAIEVQRPSVDEVWQSKRDRHQVTIEQIDYLGLPAKRQAAIYFGQRGRAIALHDIPDDSDIVIFNRGGKLFVRSMEKFLEKYDRP